MKDKVCATITWQAHENVCDEIEIEQKLHDTSWVKWIGYKTKKTRNQGSREGLQRLLCSFSIIPDKSTVSVSRTSISKSGGVVLPDYWVAMCESHAKDYLCPNRKFDSLFRPMLYAMYMLLADTIHSFTMRILYSRPKLNILTFRPILGWKYSCEDSYDPLILTEYKVDYDHTT